jgi:hypothetical protein
MIRVKYAVLASIALALAMNLGTAWASTCGDAYFNDEITWWHNSPLYFSVAGAPANTCGDVWTWRNGSGFNMEAGDWICTDGNGNATKGPWHWSSHTEDELAVAYIDWGTCTSPQVWHIWDVLPPTVTVTSSCPSSFAGTASDPQWGAGFDSDWSACLGEFYNSTTGRWWDPATGSYNSTTPKSVACTCNSMPALNITWSCSTIPTSHVPSQSYVWYAWAYDGGNWDWDDCPFTG